MRRACATNRRSQNLILISFPKGGRHDARAMASCGSPSLKRREESELEPTGELQASQGGPILFRDGSLDGSGIAQAVDTTGGLAVVHVVQDVVGLHKKLHGQILVNPEVLREGGIHIEHARTPQGVAAQVAPRAGRGPGKCTEAVV